jgi:non-specific serine/threonine protein kinase/serine/threonine-protein kinase
MSERRRCPECDAEVSPRAAPDGICPRCLLQLAFTDPGDDAGLPPDESATTAIPSPSLEPGDRIGPYRLVQKLGEGGMGIVYHAEQEQPIRRRVALKLIKAGMDTAQVIARFESERQALALMDHTNIARVFDAGTTEQGRPYFVMEYVQGVPITEYCDKHRSTTKQRLELLLQVYAGVQHAHQKGIIHRDIKPSNVLVSLQEGRPVPKIIDFGVAKATAKQLTEHSLFTELGVLIGTPEYMSPEQAELTALDIDTRTDVYSLGVLQYELLVGALPFERKELRQRAFDEICRRIREEEPSKPSTRVSKLGSISASLAEQRRTDPRSLARQLRGDLDWITMKALEKDRTRRFGSVDEFAADIKRYLQHEPVGAGPPSAAYRARKFIRRHRVGVAFAAVVVLLLAGLVVTMSIQAARVARERDTAEEVSEFLVRLFEVSDPSESRGRTITAREVLDKGVERIEHELTDQPEIRGRLLHTMGSVYRGLGLYESSRPLLEGALENRRALYGDAHPETLLPLVDLARLNLKRGSYGKSEEQYRRLLELSRRVHGKEHRNTLAAMNGLGNVLRILGRYDEAEPLLAGALDAGRRMLGPEDVITLATMVNLAVLRVRQGRFDDARPLFLESLEIRRDKGEGDSLSALATMIELAWLCVKQGRYEEARDWYTDALDHRRRILGEEHPDTLTIMSSLANVYRILGDGEQAESLFLEALEVQQRILDPGDRDLAATRGNLGAMYLWQERYGEAEVQLLAALEIMRESVGDDHSETLTMMNLLAETYFRQGRLEQAESIFLRNVATRERVFGEDHPGTLDVLHKLGRMYRDLGRNREAEEILTQVVEARSRVLGEDHPRTQESMAVLNDVLDADPGEPPP